MGPNILGEATRLISDLGHAAVAAVGARDGRGLLVQAHERRAVGLGVARIHLLVRVQARRRGVHLRLLGVAGRGPVLGRPLGLPLRVVHLRGVLARSALLLVGGGLGADGAHLVVGAGAVSCDGRCRVSDRQKHDRPGQRESPAKLKSQGQADEGGGIPCLFSIVQKKRWKG